MAIWLLLYWGLFRETKKIERKYSFQLTNQLKWSKFTFIKHKFSEFDWNMQVKIQPRRLLIINKILAVFWLDCLIISAFLGCVLKRNLHRIYNFWDFKHRTGKFHYLASLFLDLLKHFCDFDRTFSNSNFRFSRIKFFDL
jgi:hypothetical protein